MFRFFPLFCCFVAFEIAAMAGLQREIPILIVLVAVMFHVLVIRMPLFPYPKNEVTWPNWRK